MPERHHPSQRRSSWPPEPGTFALRLSPHAWAVPALIIRDADGCWSAIIDERAYDGHQDPALAPRVSDIWTGGTIIDQAHYDWLLAVKRYAQATGDEDHPALNPSKPIDYNRLKPGWA